MQVISWSPEINWQTPAGRTLQKLFAALPPTREWSITLFGSSPLQLTFRLVIEKTGHPTEDEMRRELQASVDLYRPNIDEEMVGDITTNTAVLWQELWGKSINVRQEIIAPALAARRKGYEPDVPRVDYKADLRRLGAE